MRKEHIEKYTELILKKFEDANMNVSRSEINSCLVFDAEHGFYNKEKIEENLRRLMYQKYKKIIPLTAGINLSLEGKNFEYWKFLAQQQPIFI